MTSWRDSVSEEAQADCDGLLNQALPFAQQMLDRHGEFYPYAYKMGLDGETSMVAADPGQGEHPSTVSVLELLYGSVHAERDRLRATAVVSDVRIGSAASDAIRVEIEHREGAKLAVFLPYIKKRVGRGVKYGSLQATSAEPRVWP